MAKVAIITDSHFGARNDSQVFVEYFREFYENIFFPKLDELNIRDVIHAGDLFDRRKFVNFNILHATNKYFISQLQSRGCTTHILVGNHDTYFKNTNEINSVELILRGMRDFHVYDAPTEINIANRKIQLFPWINEENAQLTIDAVNNSDSEIAIGHFEFAGFMMHPNSPMAEGLDPTLFVKFNKVISGHFHHRHSQGNVFYLGCPYEMTFADYGDPKGFHILDTDTLELEFIENPYKMFHRELYDDTKGFTTKTSYPHLTNKFVRIVVTAKNDPVAFERFVDSVYASNPANVSIVDSGALELEGDLLTQDEEGNVLVEDTLTIIGKYVDAVEFDGDKDVVKGLFKELYIEASNLAGKDS